VPASRSPGASGWPGGGTAIFAIAPSLEVQEGGRVVFGRLASLAVLAGASTVTALAIVLARRRFSKR
jgi:hypothetical protein